MINSFTVERIHIVEHEVNINKTTPALSSGVFLQSKMCVSASIVYSQYTGGQETR